VENKLFIELFPKHFKFAIFFLRGGGGGCKTVITSQQLPIRTHNSAVKMISKSNFVAMPKCAGRQQVCSLQFVTNFPVKNIFDGFVLTRSKRPITAMKG